MAIIECINGPTTQIVGSSEYHFTLDKFERFTAKVTNLVDLRMFLSRPKVYREVPEEPLPKKKRKAVQPGNQSNDGDDDTNQNNQTTPEGEGEGGDDTGSAGESGDEGSGDDAEGNGGTE